MSTTAPASPPPSAQDGPAVALDSVRKHYGPVKAVDGVSLTVARGEFFGLLGPNGAGKTTLIEIMEGLRQADSGSVSVLGRAPWPRNVDLLPKLGVQTQASAFFVRLTAREHLRTVAALYGAGHDAAERALASVRLTDHGDTRVEDLSGGQRQRLAIAAALAHEPELIFLDEPTAALDPQARRDLWQVLRDLKGAGRTIVYTTHHLDEAEVLCDRVAIIVAGRVAALDTPARMVAAGSPTTRLLVPADRLALEAARGIPGVRSAALEGDTIVLETLDAGPVLAHVDRLAGLQGVRTRTASLEDVYLELTGGAAPHATAEAP
ncbi:ABC transporter [Streptomyces sp. CC53]|uniref:ABC transporter ATP-binding protein n=1 Tax=unclassified Streptomyces TaxID=2593676 RepID=UPI0008DC6C9E|nr:MULTISPECIES: ABC transporter ATP-binding protein [unclassified Streptomyces]OII64979.1 ABC transporter [Streptomyces sp. CC53]OII66666.1 ABC transporter [Streptomyces sp. CC77]